MVPEEVGAYATDNQPASPQLTRMRSVDEAQSASPPSAVNPRRALRKGDGRLVVSNVEGLSTVTTSAATNPMKLLVPRARAICAWAFTSTFGGGLLAGDCVDLDITVGEHSSLLLGTQASTKVYRSPNALAAKQSLHATVAAGALLAVLPDPVTCFANASYEQRQRFDVAPGGSLLLLDWITSGRLARGERWAFTRYLSRNDFFMADRHVASDALLLDGAFEPISSPQRMGRFDCYATLFAVGPLVSAGAKAMIADVTAVPLRRNAPLLVSASPLAEGVVLRVLGDSAERVGRFLRDRLAFAWPLVGEDPWTRKP